MKDGAECHARRGNSVAAALCAHRHAKPVVAGGLVGSDDDVIALALGERVSQILLSVCIR